MIAQSAAAILQSRAEQAEANRRAMPQVSAWLDDLRQTFPNAMVKYAREGGRTAGRKREFYEVAANQIVLKPSTTKGTEPCKPHKTKSPKT